MVGGEEEEVQDILDLPGAWGVWIAKMRIGLVVEISSGDGLLDVGCDLGGDLLLLGSEMLAGCEGSVLESDDLLLSGGHELELHILDGDVNLLQDVVIYTRNSELSV